MHICFLYLQRTLLLYFWLFFSPNYANDVIRPPRFLSEPIGSESLVNEGQTKILHCQVIGHPQPTFQWLKDWKPIGEFSNEHFLRLSDISVKESGEYRCLAKNSAGVAVSPRIVLNVAYMNPLDFSNETESVVKVIAGRYATLSLPNVTSYPQPSVSWRSEADSVLYNIHYEVTDPLNDLVILDTRPEDAQVYSATITNTQLGHELVSPGVRVELEGEINTDNISPSFVVPPRNVTILKGTSISQLQCIANARPLFELETLWFKDDALIERSGVKYFFKKPWNRTLSLLEVSPTHSGRYECRIRLRNSLDEPLIGVAHVTVEIPPTLKEVLPEETEGNLGKSLLLSCPAEGIPEPEVSWFWDGRDVALINDSRYSVLTNGSFYISAVALNDTGNLQCIVSNEVGETSSNSWLRVKSISGIRGSVDKRRSLRVVRDGLRGVRPQTINEAFSTAPALIVPPSNVTAVDGQSCLRIHCQATGAPKPNVTWLYNDEPLSLSIRHDLEILPEGDLILKGVRKEIAGKFTCRRANEAGQVEGSAWLQILVKTMIIVPPTDISVTLGHVAILHCKFTSADSVPVHVKWYHEGNLLSTTAPQVTVRNDGTLVIEQVRATDAGSYSCVVTSPGGNDTRTAHLKVMDLPYAPKLVTAVKEEGVPKTARVSWTKNFDGNSPIIKFIIFKRKVPPSGIAADLGLNWEEALTNVSAGKTSVLVPDLRPSTSYQFKVAAVNNVGQGPPSEPSDILILPQEAPSGPPQGLVGSPRSNSEIMIQWEPPIEAEVNGVLKGYMVRYRLWGYKDAQWYYRNVTKQTQHNYLITGLITWKDHEIQVAAYNAKGVGVYTPGIRVKTKEGIPLAPPRDVSVTVVSSTAVKVTWKPPLPWMINGINQGYKVQAWKDKSSNASDDPIVVRVVPSPYPDAQESVVVDGLQKFTEYSITVLCFTHPGDGNMSIPIRVKTIEDVPDKVSFLKFDEISDRHVRVFWGPPHNQNGILKGYTLSYYEKGSEASRRFDPISYNLTADVTSKRISNLTATTYYTFEVYAWTSVGSGKVSTATIQSSVEPVKPDPPTRLAVSNIQPFSVVLQFTPGFDGNSSIDTWRVEGRSWRSSSWEVIYETSDPDATTLTVENLIPYTKYSLRLIAVNVAGPSDPSKASPRFQTLQAQPSHSPSNMTLRAMSPTEVRVRWIPLQQHEWFGAPHGYLIKYRPSSCNCSYSESFVSDITANYHQLELLEEFTEYEIKMCAVNDVGNSAYTVVAVERTRESMPSAGPSNVTARATSSTTIVVQWGSVPMLDQNGILEGYKVVYAGRNIKPEEKIIDNNETFSATLTQLKKFYPYSVRVSAFTRLGDGVLSSPPLLVQTLEDVPGPPSDVSFPDVSFTYARIIWDEPKDPNGVITAYDVTYHLTEDHTTNHTIEFGPSVRTYRVEDLMPERNYMFLLRAKTRLGWGQILRAPVYTTNNRELPAPPSGPSISNSQITSHSILFTWKPGKDGFAPIRYYSVQYSEDDNDWQDVEERIEYSATSHTVGGLRPFTSYKFRIQATNDIGQSGWSEESLKAQTKPSAPTHPPTDIKVIPITRTSIRIEWVPLFPEAWSGDPGTGGYRVKFRQLTDILSTFGSQKRELFNVTARSIVLDNLERDTNYEIVVTSFNMQGESPPSAPQAVYVGEAVPTGTPRNVTAIPLSSTEIRIEWKPPKEQDQNGELSGYKIFYRKTSNSSSPTSATKRSLKGPTEEVEVVGPLTTSFELLYLDMYTEYVIMLLCFNPYGEGPRSEPITVRTEESTPGPVANLGFDDITMNSLKVVWDPPSKPNGHIVGYLVTYETAKSYENFSKQVKQKVTTPHLLVQSLKEEVSYKFSVRAETIGYGPEVEANVTTGPQPGSPGRPKEVYLSQTVSSVTLHWRNGHSGRAPLLGYYIEAKKKDGDEWVVLMKSDTGELEEFTVSFQNLLPSTTYAFRLIAYNRYGISYPTLADQMIVTPTKVVMEYGYLQVQPFYHSTWFMVSLASTSVVIIIIVIAALCVKSNTYKYKRVVASLSRALDLEDASNKTLEESLEQDDGVFPSYEMTARSRSSKRGGTLGSRGSRGTLGSRRSLGGAAAMASSKAPPRPTPASVTYSDDDTVKGYDRDPDDDDSSDVTEKPTDISSTDSQGTDSGPEDDEVTSPSEAQNSSFVSHYANVNEAFRDSWRRQRPVRNYAAYTDSEAEGSAVMSLNGGQIIMNNMAGSRAPLPGFSSFV